MRDYLKLILLMVIAGKPILAGTTNTRSTASAPETGMKTYSKLVKRMAPELERRYREFFQAAEEGNLETIKEFIALGFDVNYHDGLAIWKAADGHLEVVKTLLEAGANPDASDRIGDKGHPLRVAAGNNDLEMINLLLKAGASVNFRLVDILHDAARNGHVEAIQRLLEAGADPNGHYGMPLQLAVKNDHLDVVNTLIEDGADVNLGGELTMDEAAKQGLLEIMKALIKGGGNTRWFGTLMGSAAYHGQLDIVKLMLENGANPSGRFILRDAVKNGGDVEVVRALLEAGSNITYQNDDGYPLHYAMVEGHSEITELLVEYGGDINRGLDGDYFTRRNDNSYTKYGNGWTVMHVAARWGHPMIQKLVELGADINIQDTRGYTPIQIAIKFKKLFVAKEMLKYCADLSPINEEGDTALDMVKNMTSKYTVSINATLTNATSANATLQNAKTEPTEHENLMEVLTKTMPGKICCSPDDETTIKAIRMEFEEMVFRVNSTLKDQVKYTNSQFLWGRNVGKIDNAIRSLFEETFLGNITQIFEDHKCAVALYDQDTIAVATVAVGKEYMAKCKCIPGQGPKMSFAPIV